MKGKNFSVTSQRWKYVSVDFIMMGTAFLLFNIFRFNQLDLYDRGYADICQYLLSSNLLIEQILVPFLAISIYWLSGYYNQPFLKSRLSEFSVTLYSTLFLCAILYLILLINDSTGLRIKDYELIFAQFFLNFVAIYLGRYTITTHTIKKLKQKKWKYITLIVGNSIKSRYIYRKMKDSGSVWTYDVVGFIRLNGETQVDDDLPTWNWDEVKDVCHTYCVDQIVLAPERIRDNDVMRILKELFPLDIPVKIAPDTLSYITSNIRLNDILGIPFVDLTSPRISEFQKNVKRAFDVIVSVLTMVILLPFLGIIATIVKFTSPGPVIYSQERLGLKRKPFEIYKFRSMRIDAEIDGPQLSHEGDARITSFGRFMRKYRVDELPQFWNVLKGDMSLVGPRPEREFYINQIIKQAPYYGLIFQVRPGVTSWGMVKYGYASNVEQMVTRSRYDLLYITNMSLATDIKIIIYTVKTVLGGEGK